MIAFIQRFDPISPWLLGLVFIAILSVVIEAGYRTARKLRGDRELDKHPIETSVTGTVTGLLAFMLAFTFGGSVNRYSDIRNLALADTIAIENTFDRTDVLAEPEQTEAKKILVEYLSVRLEALKSGDPSQIEQAVQRSSILQARLWDLSINAQAKSGDSVMNTFVNAVGEMGNANTRRVHKATVTRLPSMLWACLLFLAALASFLLGMSSGFHGRRSRFAATAMLIGFSSVFVLIIDLDRPIRSFFQVTDETSEALLERMERETP
ncbi:hypothetical protein [Haloferula sp.]|uniref:bestrophin-like domain n=1 Tax=Haloferula sp. TaxID=2497595 RepID=UPI0032A0271C